jgi:ornithine cyclodeaminase/alanine dehydrogenase-like protein (mu-crystallin family)
MSSPTLITEENVRRLLDPAKLIAAIESAFRDRYPSVTIPPRVDIPLADGTFLAMSCYDRSGHALGIKLVTVQSNPQSHQGGVHATYLLLDPETAQPRLTIAANYLTELRTAATSAVASRFLARADAATLGIFGTGRLARAHLQVLPLVRSFQRVLICGRDASRSAAFVADVAPSLPRDFVTAADARTCAAESDVLCTCTASTTSLFDGPLLRPGTHLNLTGAFQPHRREVDTTTIQRSRVIVDTYAEAPGSGDLSIPLQEAAIARDHIVSDLHELLSRKKQGRRASEEITAFKSVGCALEDLVTAELLLAAHSQS